MLLSVVKEILKTKTFSCHFNDVELLIICVYSDPLSSYFSILLTVSEMSNYQCKIPSRWQHYCHLMWQH